MYGDLSKRFELLLLGVTETERGYLTDAYDFAYKAHLGQKRKSGEDYFIHPLAVALKLHDKFGDHELTCAGLLHDTVEDNPDINIQDIYIKFGFEIGYIVDAVTKNKQQFYGEDFVFERKIDKFLAGGMKNIKCFLLKLADRNDNIKTITNLKDNKQVRMAFETQAIFTPLEEIIGFKNNISIEDTQRNLDDFIKDKNIKGYIELKNYLINKTFRNFSTECFDSVYQNTGNVTWKINDTDIFNDFLSIPNIEEKIKVISVNSNIDNSFSFNFRFKKGEIVNDSIKLEIGNTYSI